MEDSKLLNSLQWPINFINSNDNTKLPCYTLSYQPNTTVSSETYPFVQLTSTITFNNLLSQPQECYVAFTFSLKHCWTYFFRTLPDIQDLLDPLENAISSSSEWDILALPVHHGGLGITNPCHEANHEYQLSVKVSMSWVEKIVSKHMSYQTTSITGVPSFNCEMITLRNMKSYGEIIICMGIFTTSLRNIKIQSNTQ